MHGAKDFWERLEWICGIAELIRGHDAIDWEIVRRNARELGVERIFFLGLFLATELFAARLPEAVMHQLEAQPAIESLANEVLENIMRTNSRSLGLRKKILFHIRSRERFLDRLRYCFRLLFTTTPVDWGMFPLPTSLTFLYSLLRPLRLAKKYAAHRSKSVAHL